MIIMIESQEHRENLIKFAEKLRFKSQSFPQDEDGNPTEKYLEYISLMYDSEIVKIAIEIDVIPKTSSGSQIARKLGINKKELLKKIEPVLKRGFIFKIGPRFTLPTPLFIYDMPFILEENFSRKDSKEFAKLSREFFEEGYYKTWETNKEGLPRTRVLTISEEIEDPKEIVPIEEVYKIIDMNEDFALVGCPCRKRRDVEGIRECNYPLHTCINLGTYAKAVLDMGDPAVKRVSKEEVKEIMKKAAEAGLVHTTDNRAEDCSIICNCCECCCVLLTGLTKFDNPRAIAKANYISQINIDNCIGSETCLSRCKFGAIEVDIIAKVDADKCVGCGLCAVTCPDDAITMKRMEREEIPRYNMGGSFDDV